MPEWEELYRKLQEEREHQKLLEELAEEAQGIFKQKPSLEDTFKSYRKDG